MTPAQSEIAATVRRQLGDDAADELAAGWTEAGVDQPRTATASADELGRLLAWRLSSNPRRRQTAIARLARLGYDVRLKRRGRHRLELDVRWGDAADGAT